MRAFSMPQNILGEGPLWDAESQALWWVDIHGKTIFRQAWNQSQAESHSFEKRPTALGFSNDKQLIIAFEDGIFRWSPSTQRTPLKMLNERASNRTNDGKVGPDGQFWFGTMDDEEQLDSGALYSLSTSGQLTQHQAHIGISNTFAWSPDGQWFYFADSKAQRIYQYPVTSSGLGTAEIFVDLQGTSIYPDGSCIDSEGCLWNAQWDGHRVVRYAPDGSILQIVSLPVQRPTSCCFGGPEGSHLFVTTASVGLTESDMAAQPLAGKVLVIETNATGTVNHYWGQST